MAQRATRGHGNGRAIHAGPREWPRHFVCFARICFLLCLFGLRARVSTPLLSSDRCVAPCCLMHAVSPGRVLERMSA